MIFAYASDIANFVCSEGKYSKYHIIMSVANNITASASE